MEEWLKTYSNPDTFSDSELDAEITWLKTQTRNPYNAQTQGTRSYARSTAEFRDRLAAASEAKRLRSAPQTARHGSIDFSKFQP